MNADSSTIEDDLEAVINQPGTKSDRARALFALGCDRKDAVELLDMNYSQAHALYKRWQEGDASGGSRPTRRGHARQSAGAVVEPSLQGSGGGSRYLRLSPTQVRYITQGDHVVVRVDTSAGTLCGECQEHATFSLKYLGFVHTNSAEVPTNIEDHYPA